MYECMFYSLSRYNKLKKNIIETLHVLCYHTFYVKCRYTIFVCLDKNINQHRKKVVNEKFQSQIKFCYDKLKVITYVTPLRTKVAKNFYLYSVIHSQSIGTLNNRIFLYI